jgi:hypothetical protein
MAYFPNGTASEMYYDKYCTRCKFDRNGDCPIWGLHLLHNYEECNKEDSFLHVLIPRCKDVLDNEQCRFFTPLLNSKDQQNTALHDNNADVSVRDDLISVSAALGALFEASRLLIYVTEHSNARDLLSDVFKQDVEDFLFHRDWGFESG